MSRRSGLMLLITLIVVALGLAGLFYFLSRDDQVPPVDRTTVPGTTSTPSVTAVVPTAPGGAVAPTGR